MARINRNRPKDPPKDQPKEDKPKEKKPALKTVAQVIDHLLATKELKGMVARNMLTMTDMMQHPVPGHDDDDRDYPRVKEAEDIIRLQAHLQRSMKSPGLTDKAVRDALLVLAQENAYDPAINDLQGLEPVPRSQVARRHLLARTFDLYSSDERQQAYIEDVSVCFVNSLVMRVMDPGSKCDSMLVIVGPQGIGKSTFCKLAAMANDRFADSLPPIAGNTYKEARQALIGMTVVEMPEFEQYQKPALLAHLKSYLSATTDWIRLPYAGGFGHYERRCVFIGTTNKQVLFSDETGNRRFWSIEVIKVDLEYFRHNLPLALAEAMAEYEQRGALRTYLTAATAAVGEEKARDLSDEDPLASRVSRWLLEKFEERDRRGKDEPIVVVAEQFLKDTQLTEGDVIRDMINQHGLQIRIGKIFTTLGGSRKRETRNGVKETRYYFNKVSL